MGRLHLAVVYLVWGSTFMAIRIAVGGDGSGGGGFAPFTLSALRVIAGGLLLMFVAALQKTPLFPGAKVLPGLALSGVLLWAGGHAALLWGSQRAESGYAAILFGATPLVSLAIELALGRRRADARLIGWVVVGLGGIVLLTLPALGGGGGGAAAPAAGATLALLAAPVGWALGSTLQSREVRAMPAVTSAAYQQLFGGAACVLLALLAGEGTGGIGAARPRAWLALGYLVVPGCMPAFTSYVRALQLLPTSVVMSFAYVNPVIAVLLGAWLLDEHIGAGTVLGMALVAAGVAGVFRREAHEGPPEPRLARKTG